MTRTIDTAVRALIGVTGAIALCALPAAAVAQGSNPGESGSGKMHGQPMKAGSMQREQHVTATIESVDKDARVVTLVDQQGDRMTVQAPADMKNFDKLKVGDQVKMTYYQSLAVAIYKPGEAKPNMETGRGSASIPAGGGHGPGRMMAQQTEVTADVVSVNPDKNQVTFRGPEGQERVVNVQDPQLQAKLRDLKPGDKVQMVYTEAVAATIQPMGKKK